MATGGLSMNTDEFMRTLVETPEQREAKRFRSLEALEEAGLLTFLERRELWGMRRQRVLAGVR